MPQAFSYLHFQFFQVYRDGSNLTPRQSQVMYIHVSNVLTLYHLACCETTSINCISEFPNAWNPIDPETQFFRIPNVRFRDLCRSNQTCVLQFFFRGGAIFVAFCVYSLQSVFTCNLQEWRFMAYQCSI